MSGTAVTVQPVSGGSPQTITVPTTVKVTKTTGASFSDLAVNDCIAATGPRDSGGAVQATTLVISPAGPSGCFSGGGFGGGRRFGGGGDGPPGAAPPAGGGGGPAGGPPPGD